MHRLISKPLPENFFGFLRFSLLLEKHTLVVVQTRVLVVVPDRPGKGLLRFR